MTDKDRRRQWAQEQISHHQREIEPHQREIEKLEEFLALLDASDAALSADGTPARPRRRKRRVKHKRKKRSLADYIEHILREANGVAMKAAEIATAAEALGYRHKSKKYSLAVTVSSELCRLWKERRRGIERLAKGEYAIPKKQAV